MPDDDAKRPERAGQPETPRDDEVAGRAGLPPTEMRDPRLEIPEVLRTPVKRPVLPSDRKFTPTPRGSGGLADLAKALTLGLDFLFIIAAGGFFGWLFDQWRGTGHAGVVTGLAVGFLAGTYRLLRRLNRDDWPRSGPGRGPGGGSDRDPGSPKR